MKKILFLLAWAGVVWADVTVYSPFGTVTGTYTTIQEGVNVCIVGGTVSVAAGTYTEAVYIFLKIKDIEI